MIAELKQLWAEAFEDSQKAIDDFFATGFSTNRHHCILQDGIPVSALYWFDCELNGQKLAYLYAVATLQAYRGQGLARQLLTQTHEILKAQGYAGALLVPGETDLFSFYEKLGYRAVCSVREFVCEQAEQPAALQEVSAEEYARLRKTLLPAQGVTQEGAMLDYLQTYCKFYTGDGFLLSAACGDSHLLTQEFLGDAALAGQIVTAFGATDGHFRMPGAGRDFAMLLPFTDDCPKPTYFGLALD